MDALGDFFRFWWALLALNTRKSFARARGQPPPCQAPGDSGRAHETVCEACLQWNKVGRFRRVCPLLKWTPAGWRCSADAADVRPFWGRAGAAYGFLAATLWLGGTIAAFGGLRAVGYRVNYLDVVWPPAWVNVTRARADYYTAQGRAALAAGRIHEAGLALGLATTLDPTNYPAGFALAQLWQPGQPALSDRAYRRLLGSHPAQAAATAQAWAHALLLRGDFRELAALATERLTTELTLNPGWLHALIFSTRRLGDRATLRTLLARPDVDPITRLVLQDEFSEIGDTTPTTAGARRQPLPESASEYARYHQIKTLIRHDDAAHALELLQFYGSRLAANERIALTLRALGAVGATERRRAEFTALLAGNTEPELHAILATDLIYHPDAALLRLTLADLDQRAWTTRPAGAPALSALLCAAAVDGDPASVAQLRTRLRRAAGGKLVALDRIGEFFRVAPGTRPVGNFLALLPMLPRETAYAIHEWAARAAVNPRPVSP